MFRLLLLAAAVAVVYLLWRRHWQKPRTPFGDRIPDARQCALCGIHGIKGAVACNKDDCPMR